MNNQEKISQEEKIDFIYSYLKKEAIRRKYKFIFYVIVLFFLLGYLLYFYFVVIPSIKNSLNIFNLGSISNNSKNENSLNIKGFESKLDELKSILDTKNINF